MSRQFMGLIYESLSYISPQFIIAATTAAATILGVSGVSAQDFTLPPTFGQVSLNAGFTPDPHSVAIVGGGPIDATPLGAGCWGSIADAPDYRLNYGAGGFPLIFSVLSNSDTTLIINDPFGNWICDDDSGGNLNPFVEIANPSSGQYDIWVGTFGGGAADATLNISELGTGGGQPPPPPPPPNAGGPDIGLPPTFGRVSLNAGFTPDPHSVAIVGGGPIDAFDALGGNCFGSIAEAPDYRLNYNAGGFPLIFSVLSNSNTTLIINDPFGNWICDDDSGGNLSPLVEIANPSSGQYDIWIGTFGGGAADGTLNISELGTGGGQPPPPPPPPNAGGSGLWTAAGLRRGQPRCRLHARPALSQFDSWRSDQRL